MCVMKHLKDPWDFRKCTKRWGTLGISLPQSTCFRCRTKYPLQYSSRTERYLRNARSLCCGLLWIVIRVACELSWERAARKIHSSLPSETRRPTWIVLQVFPIILWGKDLHNLLRRRRASGSAFRTSFLMRLVPPRRTTLEKGTQPPCGRFFGDPPMRAQRSSPADVRFERAARWLQGFPKGRGIRWRQ